MPRRLLFALAAVLSTAADPRVRTDAYGDPLPPGATARLGSTRFRAEVIVSLAYTPDGKTLIAASLKDIVFWDAATGRELLRLRAAGRQVTGLALSPDGKTIACGSMDEKFKHSLQLWDVAKQEKVFEQLGPRSHGLRWSGDSKTLAQECGDGKVHLWDVPARKELRQFQAGATNGVDFSSRDTIALSADGRTLAAKRPDGSVRVWAADTGEERMTTPVAQGYIVPLALTDDGGTLAVGRQRAGVEIWDVKAEKQVRTIAKEVADPSWLRFRAGGKELLAGGRERFGVWDVESGKQVAGPDKPTDCGAVAAVSPDDRRLASRVASGTVVGFWDFATGEKAEATEGHSGPGGAVAWSPDGATIATCGPTGGLWLWDTATGKPLLRQFGPKEYTRHVAFISGGRELVTAPLDNTLRVFDARSGEERRRIPLLPDGAAKPVRSVDRLETNDDGTMIIASGRENDTGVKTPVRWTTAWESATGKPVFTWSGESRDTPVAPAPDRSWVVWSDQSSQQFSSKGPSSFAIKDARTGRILRTMADAAPITIPVALSPDGRLVASEHARHGSIMFSENGGISGLVAPFTVRVWDVATGKQVCELPMTAETPSAAFAPDGRLLAVRSEAGVEFYDALNGRKVGHNEVATGRMAIAFSRDGRRMVTGMPDGTLLVWDLSAVREKVRQPAGNVGAEAAWADLADADPAKALPAVAALAGQPEKAVLLLKGRLKPASAVAEADVKRLIADLDAGAFAARDKATKQLEELAEQAEPYLRKAIEAGPTAEANRRIGDILDRTAGPVMSPDRLRATRAVQVLELIGTPDARGLLREWAAGGADARLTREASAALRRLER
jgi:WD40 repeat protein